MIAQTLQHFTTTDGVKLSYWIQGKGRPLVLLHGWSGSHKSFIKNLPVLAQQFQVIGKKNKRRLLCFGGWHIFILCVSMVMNGMDSSGFSWTWSFR
jgi:hypothetical protein